MQITIFIHAHVKAFLEPARLALIAVRLVDDAVTAAGLASIIIYNNHASIQLNYLMFA